MIVDTHVHVFTDDRKNYPQLRDTARADSIPSISEIGQTEWPLTTTENLIALFALAGNPNVYFKTAIRRGFSARPR